MAEDDFEERAIPASRGRRCARLKPVPPAPLGEQAGAPSSAGAPVGFSSKIIHGLTGDYWRCRHYAALGAIYCGKHNEAVLLPSQPVSVRPETLRIECEEIFEYIADTFPNKIGEVFYDSRRRSGRRTKGILDEDVLMDAINTGLMNDRARRARLDELCRVSRNLTRPEVRELRELLVGAAPAEKLNTKTVAEHYGIKERAARNLVRAANSPIGREVDSMPLTKADMNELREELEERYEALHADVRASLGILLERFPGNAAVEAAVDEFLDDTLGD